LGKQHLSTIEALGTAQLDALLKELRERFAQPIGVEMSVSTMQRAVGQLK
jgi:hypothetical protein